MGSRGLRASAHQSRERGGMARGELPLAPRLLPPCVHLQREIATEVKGGGLHRVLLLLG